MISGRTDIVIDVKPLLQSVMIEENRYQCVSSVTFAAFNSNCIEACHGLNFSNDAKGNGNGNDNDIH